MKYVEIEDLIDLSLGAAILGSGGGGSPEYDLMIAQQHAMDYGNAVLVDAESLQSSDLIVPIGFAGAPLVANELLPSGKECEIILQTIEQLMAKKPTHLMPAEIGGANALCPFLFAARLQIPIVDADTLGRAFPELQMSSCNLFGVSPCPAFIADAMGSCVTIQTGDALSLERIARKAIIAMGSSALAGIYLMDGATAKQSVIPKSISYAMELGKTVRQARKKGEDPLKILQKNHGAKVIGEGIIDTISQTIEDGFLKGCVSITTGESEIEIAYQNEYLLVSSEGNTLCVTPEIIVIVERDSFTPILSDKLLFGMRVILFTLPAPAIWTTPKGIELVGPGYFGYETMKGGKGE